MRARGVWRLLRLYLDPFALFRVDALSYNRRVRRILLTYARRWIVIALLCLAVIARLVALARGPSLVWIPLAALEVGFSGALCLSFLSVAAYFVLGLED
jgi:hypothetical protein